MAFEINKEKLKSLWADVSGKAQAAAQTAAKKTGEVAESAKLNITLKTEQQKLGRLFASLGKLYYEKAEEAQLAAQVMEIDEQKKIIEDLKVVIAEQKGKILCPACGKEIDGDSLFCSGCGAKQEQKKNVTTDEAAPEAPKAEAAPEAPKCAPLSAEEFIEFFKATMDKYFA